MTRLLGGQPSPTTVETDSTEAEISQAETAQPPVDPAPDASLAAQQRMQEAALAPFRDLPGRFGIAVRDLGSGRAVLLNEAVPFQAASLYKLPVMYEVFKMREQGLLSFDELLTIGPADAAYDLGTLPWPIGTRITLGTALERMITLSDNSSAFMLTRRVGAWRINEDAARLGLSQTRVHTDDLATSALDMLHLLELIAGGQAVDTPTSAEMVRLLARQQIRDRIPAFLPAEATVANKTGDWDDAAHDVGLVYTPRATLAVAFLSDAMGDPDATNAAMARAARDLYDLAGDPTFATQPDPPLPPLAYASYASEPRLPLVSADPSPPRAPVQERAAQPTPVPTLPPSQRNGATPAPTPTDAPDSSVPAPRTDSGAVRPSRPAPKPTSTVAPTAQPTPKPAGPTMAPDTAGGSRAGPTAQPTPTAKPRG